MLTLTPGVDFDLDLVNARVRDGTIAKMFPSTHSPLTPYADTTIVALEALAGSPVASTEFVGKSGDVLPAAMLSYLVSNRPTCR